VRSNVVCAFAEEADNGEPPQADMQTHSASTIAADSPTKPIFFDHAANRFPLCGKDDLRGGQKKYWRRARPTNNR